jgi:hypothetical protein
MKTKPTKPASDIGKKFIKVKVSDTENSGGEKKAVNGKNWVC